MSFPFFGAGDAGYFEYAALSVRFTRRPRPAERAALLADVPPPLRDGVTIRGVSLTACSPEPVHVAISLHYDADPGDEDCLDGRPIFAAESRVRRFNEDIDRWLEHLHAIVPVAVVLRAEDAEAGGTRLSDWHDESLEDLPAVLALFADHITRKRRRNPTTAMLGGILEFAAAAGADIPLPFMAWWHPHLEFTHALRTSALTHARALISPPGTDDRDAFDSALHHVDLTDPVLAAALLTLRVPLSTTERGWATACAAAIQVAVEPATDPRVAELLAAGARYLEAPSDAFLLAARRQPASLSLKIMHTGARLHPDTGSALAHYLSAVIEHSAFAAADPALLKRAGPRSADDVVLLLNTTYIHYERGEHRAGIAAIDRHEARRSLPDAALLNAALLHVCNGGLDAAEDYASRSADTGDQGAAMIAPAVLLARGDRTAALAGLRAVRDRGYWRFSAWRKDLCFKPLHGDPEYEALFTA